MDDLKATDNVKNAEIAPEPEEDDLDDLDGTYSFSFLLLPITQFNNPPDC
jgi:hypothetical protein